MVAIKWDRLARGGTATEADGEMCFLQQPKDYRWPPVLSVALLLDETIGSFGLITCQVGLDVTLAVAASTL